VKRRILARQRGAITTGGTPTLPWHELPQPVPRRLRSQNSFEIGTSARALATLSASGSNRFPIDGPTRASSPCYVRRTADLKDGMSLGHDYILAVGGIWHLLHPVMAHQANRLLSRKSMIIW